MRMQYPPNWTPALNCLEELLKNGDQRRSAWLIDAITALIELRVLSADARPFTAHATESWQSSISDLRAGLSRLGPRLTSAVADDVRGLLGELKNLPLKDVAFINSIRSRIASKCDAALAKISAPASSLAAWDDLYESATSSSNWQEICNRRDLFIAAIRLRGYSPARSGAITDRIEGVLADDVFHVLIAQAELSPAMRSRLDGLSTDAATRPSGTPLDERLQLIRDLLLLPLQPVQSIVWLVYRAALMGDFSLSLGQVSFYRLDWFMEVLNLDDDSDKSGIPKEALEHREAFRTLLLASETMEPGLVGVRIEVGEQLQSRAVEQAKELAEITLAASVGFGRRKGWAFSGSYLCFDNGEPGRSAWGVPERDRYRHWNHEPPLDLTDASSWLPAELNEVRLQPELSWTLDAIRSLTDAPDTASSARLTIAVQAIERVNATTVNCDTWTAFARDYLRTAWVVSEIYERLHGAILAASSGASMFAADESSESLIPRTAIIELGWSHASGEALGEAIMRNAKNVLGVIEPESYNYLHLRWQMRVLSDSKRSSYIGALEAEFDEMLARSRRYRNAAVHGGPQTSEVIAWCADFATSLASRALSWKIVSHLRHRSSRETMTSLAMREEWRYSNFREGRFAEAFGPPPPELMQPFSPDFSATSVLPPRLDPGGPQCRTVMPR